MTEYITGSITGHKSLRVYPHCKPDTPMQFLAAAGHVEALTYWKDSGEKVWGVRLNIVYDEPMSRVKSDELQAAIKRCWEWIEEQQ
jgi:hypothetical protein